MGSEVMSFDLNGTDDDELLRFYLKRAGLSDDIESLSPEVRRAFVIDIIKSNKIPGQWVPSTMRPPPMANTNEMTPKRQSGSSKSGLLTANGDPQKASALPTDVKTSLKGSKYEISGPMDFRHLDGDMHRDMTKNAFDLNSNDNDNVLKKYIIEKQISEEDLGGMRKRDIIKNIIQSQFTWVPKKSKERSQQKQLEIKYATVSGRHQIPQSVIDVKESLSRIDNLDSKFADPSQFPAPDEIFGNRTSSNKDMPKLAPPPPPSDVQVTVNPYNVNNHNRFRKTSHFETVPRNSGESMKQNLTDTKFATFKAQRKTRPVIYDIPIVPQTNSRPPSPPPNQIIVKSIPPIPSNLECDGIESEAKSETDSNCRLSYTGPVLNEEPTESSDNATTVASIPPPPPPPLLTSPTMPSPVGVPPPPPPPPAPAGVPAPPPISQKIKPANEIGPDAKDALLASIRQGVTLKKVNKAATVSGPKPAISQKPPAVDFLSELKQGINLRKAKGGVENDENESQA